MENKDKKNIQSSYSIEQWEKKIKDGYNMRKNIQSSYSTEEWEKIKIMRKLILK